MKDSKIRKIVAEILSKTNDDIYKISQIHLRKMKGTKKLFDMNYNNFKTDDTLMDELKIGKRYVVKADISNCFPSIYTHSIPDRSSSSIPSFMRYNSE